MTSGAITFTAVLADPPRVCLHYRDAETGLTHVVNVEDDPRARSVSERDTVVVVEAKCFWTPRERVGGRPLLRAIALNRVSLKVPAASQVASAQEQVNRLAELEPTSDTPPPLST